MQGIIKTQTVVGRPTLRNPQDDRWWELMLSLVVPYGVCVLSGDILMEPKSCLCCIWVH